MIVASNVNNSLLVVVIAQGIFYGTPLLFASLGELLAERSGGALNLGVEGMMLVGAAIGFWISHRFGGSPGVLLTAGILAGAFAGAVMAAIHAFMVITLRANQIVSGLALTIFAGGGRPLDLRRRHVQPDRRLQPPAAEPGPPRLVAAGWPVVGPDPVPPEILVYLSWVLVIVLIWYLEPDAARAEPGAPSERGARRRRRHGHRRRRRGIATSADRRRGARRCGGRLHHARDHPAVGRRDHRRRRLDRDRARDLRVLAAPFSASLGAYFFRGRCRRSRPSCRLATSVSGRPCSGRTRFPQHRDDRRARDRLGEQREAASLGAPGGARDPVHPRRALRSSACPRRSSPAASMSMRFFGG